MHNADGRVKFLRTPEANEAHNLQVDWEQGDVVGFSPVRRLQA
jgi:hypothetical protein